VGQADRPHGISNAEYTVDPSRVFARMDQLRRSPFFRALEDRLTALLEPRPGGCLLDVGCGTGEAVLGLARLVGPSGRVVGVDLGTAMIAEAHRRSEGVGLQVGFQVMDAHRLDFVDGSFDGCRAARVLQHVEDPGRVVAEMVRVTRPGGRVVAYDPDWGTALVSGADRATTRVVLECWCDGLRHGWMGRQLPGLFRRAGVADLVIEPLINWDAALGASSLREVTDWGLETAATRAREAGVITAAQAVAWLEQLDEAVRGGTFLAAITYFLVAGRKP
jgi:SAM-dependent methyltransferase